MKLKRKLNEVNLSKFKFMKIIIHIYIYYISLVIITKITDN